jgi:outer membrane protein insertion porin family
MPPSTIWRACDAALRVAATDPTIDWGTMMAFRTLRRLMATVCLLAAASLAEAPFSPALAQTAGVIREVVVIGNRRIEPATVASYLAVGVGDVADDAALNASVRRLFDTGLFSDASVAFDGGQLIVRVAENPTINRVAVEGNRSIDDEAILGNVSSQSRRAFTRSRAEADAQVITDLYRRAGRYGTRVEPVIINLPDNRVDLVFEVTESRVTGVNAINFIGNEVFSDRRLRRVIETSESGIFSFALTSDIYDPDRLEFDRELLRRFYLQRGYADFTVLSAVAELAPDGRGFFITFTVSEGPQYTFGEQTVNVTAPGLAAEDFEGLIIGRSGDTYDATLVERSIERMIFAAGVQGFAFVDVRPRAIRDPGNQVIDIVYDVFEGQRIFVERIDIEGNTRTLDRVIRRQFDIVEGDAFNTREIDNARRRIRALGYFSEVQVATERGSTDDRANVRVTVEETSTGSLTFGIGFSSADGPVGEVSLTERNFLGRGQFLRGRLVVAGERQVADFTFREPAFLDRNLEAGFNIYYIQDDRSDESSFEETNIGFVPSVAFPVSEFGRLTLSYRVSSDEIRDVRSNASPLIARDAGTALTSSVGYTYVYDQRNDPLEPTAGFIGEFGQEVAGLGGDTQYVRTTARVRGYRALFDEDVIGSVTLEAGNITSFDEDIRITDRFFLGGDRFRGFQFGGLGPRDRRTDDSLGGNNYAVARTEVSFPIGLPESFGVSGGVFADVGTLWGLDTTSFGGSTVDDSAKLRASVGVSVFIDSAFGPLRINLAYPIVEEDGDEREIFRLTAGTRF